MRFLPRFIYSSGIILRGARGDKYRTVTFRNSLATRDAGSAGGVNRGAGRNRPARVRRPPGPASPAPRGHVVPATGPAVRRTANPLERVPARPGRRRAPSGATGTRAPRPTRRARTREARPTRRVRRPTEADRTVERRVALRFVYTLRWAISAEPAELVLGCLLAQGRDNYRNDRAPTRVDVTYWDVRAFSTALCAHLLLKVMLFSGNAPCCH